MNIANLKITNFKTLRSFELDSPAKINIIVGKNGSGKTTLLEAIRFSLTGVAPTSAITSGEKQSSVSVDVLGTTIERGAGKRITTRVNGKSTTQKSVAQMIAAKTGCSDETIKLATSTDLLNAMSSNDFANYLITNNLIPAEIDFDTLLKFCPISSKAKTELSMMLPSMPEKFDMKYIEEVYTHFYSSRLMYKNNLKSKKLEAEYEGEIPKRSITVIDRELQHFICYENELEAYEKLQNAYNLAVKNRNTIRNKIAGIETRLKTLEGVRPVNAQEIEFLETQKEKNNAKKEDLQNLLNTINLNISLFSKMIETCDSHACPLSDKLICTTDKSNLKEELIVAKQKNDDEKTEFERQIARIDENNEEITKKLNELSIRAKSFDECKQLHIQRKDLLDALPQLPENPVPPKAPKTEEEKSTLEEERSRLIRYKASLDAKNDVKAISQKIEMLDEIINCLSPKNGVRQKIIEMSLAPIVAHCNRRATQLKLNFEVELRSDNGIRIFYNPDTSKVKEFLPIESASSGEQVYVLFLILDALNSLHGLGILIFDDLDKLDCNALKSLLALLADSDVQKGYEHIFVAMVDHDDALEALSALDATSNKKVIHL